MRTEDVAALLDRALEGRRLLQHPFYRRWEEGRLAQGELAAYAAQYRHLEEALPDVLRAIVVALPDGPALDLTSANLTDEVSNPAPHVELFADFARAVGAEEAAPMPATAALLELQSSATADPFDALAVLAAYEVQSADVAATKATGLRTRYGIGPDGTAFWDVHAELEAEHARWTTEALVDADPAQLFDRARTSADAWWAFLDEREAEAPVPVGV